MPWRRKQKGQALAELALVLPILLMVVFGMIEMARLVQTYLAVQHAAREGARYAVVGLPAQEACAWSSFDGYDIYPRDGVCTARKGDGDICRTEYSEFRTDAIKEQAKEAAIGLPWDPSVTEPTAPRHLGVMVQGQPSFYDDTMQDCPGVPGARVRVMVFFNLPVITPILSGALPTVRVSASTEMINEGFQTWVGAQAPPILSPMPTLDPIDTDGDGLVRGEEKDNMETAMKASPTVIGPELKAEEVRVWLDGKEQKIVQFNMIPEYCRDFWQVQYLLQFYPDHYPICGVWHEIKLEVQSREKLHGEEILDFGQGSVGFYRP